MYYECRSDDSFEGFWGVCTCATHSLFSPFFLKIGPLLCIREFFPCLSRLWVQREQRRARDRETEPRDKISRDFNLIGMLCRWVRRGSQFRGTDDKSLWDSRGYKRLIS